MADGGGGWRRNKLLYGLHWAIIAHFAFQMAYSGYMVFVVLRPEGVSGPLFAAALELPHEFMVTRRMYAMEHWIAAAGLAVYLAITEVGPRLRRARGEGAGP